MPAPRVLVTRPQPQADDWVRRLRQLGIDAQALPLLDIAAPADPRALRDALAQLATQDLVMFVSPSAVDRFLAQRAPGRQWPAGVLAGSTGEGTRCALLDAGVPASAIVSPPAAEGRFDSEALWRQLQSRRDWRGAAALIVRGDGGRDWLADALRGQGARVRFVEAYRRAAPQPDAAGLALLAGALREPARTLWLFSSSEAVGHLPALVAAATAAARPAPAGRSVWAASHALATHPRIADAARALGFAAVDVVAPSPEAVHSWLARSIQSS
jgi:uroporphyrinogen-III synthase